jgi:Asp-tRNA(Asn)/Glu-tRNA(Gln) amidotransferase A subunit family amidase
VGPASIGVPDAYPWGEPSASAHSAMALGTRALESQGVEVRTLPLPAWSADLFEAHVLIQGYEAWRCLGWEYAHHRDRLSAELRDYLEGSRDISASQYEAAQIRATQARAEVPAWLGSFDALLTPSAPDEAPEGYGSTGASTFNRLWTLLGLPCISVPGAWGTHGAPMGLQLIGRWGDDARLLALAHQLGQGLKRAASRAD